MGLILKSSNLTNNSIYINSTNEKIVNSKEDIKTAIETTLNTNVILQFLLF